MFSPRRKAQLGLLSAASILALNVMILIHGSATVHQSPHADHADASVNVPAPQLVLGSRAPAVH